MTALNSIAAMKPISADSHVTEPPDCYVDRIEAKYRDRCPRYVEDPQKGAIFVVDGIAPINMAFTSMAGIPPKEYKFEGRTLADMHRGGYDPQTRVADMDRDCVAMETIYPSVGMALYYLEDQELMRACFQAYNRWLQEFVGAADGRLIGIGQSTAQTPETLIEDMHQIKAMGLKGVMLPGVPGVEDWDSAVWDPAWRTAVDLDLPMSFHLLFGHSKQGNNFMLSKFRGGKLNHSAGLIRLNQDIIGVFIYGGVFDRHPRLKVVSVEADAGWAPHYMKRMDHAYDRHRYWLGAYPLSRMPSDYFKENVYLTFQDDETAFQIAHLLNADRLLWASDFPHSDSTWPRSQETLARQTGDLDPAVIKRIVHDNVVELYKLDA